MKPTLRAAAVLFLALIFITANATAQQSLEPFIPLKTGTPPVIDGVLDDEVWQKAPSETGFKTWYPDYGIDMVENTRVWYAYDRENLYFAFRCYDSEPDMIKSSISTRDKIRGDDWICLNLDTFNDQQSLYALYVNPMGIQMDSRATGDDEDVDFDMVWYSEGRIDDEGYTIEIRIPFKSIRYSEADPVTMGIIFERRISRRSEMGTYPPLDPQQGPNFFTQSRPLIYDDVKHYRLVELLPAVTYGTGSSIKEGDLTSDGDESSLSLTGKYGITSHLVLDGTLNPDFSQVESDAGQVDFNQRYALYYPEKRPFFLEGRENFIFGGSTAGDPLGSIIHTRMINDPSVGIKMTGKLTTNNIIAAIYARDNLPDYRNEGDDANFMILRYRRALDQDSFVGGFYTGRELSDGYNRVGGADGQIRINGSSRFGFHAFMSDTQDYGSADSNDGHALGANYYYNTRDWTVNLRLHDISEDFRTDTGYLTRTGLTRIRAGFIRMLYPGSTFLKRIDPLFNSQHIYDKYSDQWENDNAFYLSFLFPRSTRIRVGYAVADEIFLAKKLKTGGFKMNGSSQVTRQLYLGMQYYYTKKIRYVADPYQGRGTTASASVVYQPSDNFNTTFNVSFSDFYRDADDQKEFDYTIVRSKNTYQMNKYLFFRAIVEYNSFYKELTTDFLASFTYIPGTVIHLGYGSLYEKIRWETDRYVESSDFLETKRGLFFKASYLWRM